MFDFAVASPILYFHPAILSLLARWIRSCCLKGKDQELSNDQMKRGGKVYFLGGRLHPMPVKKTALSVSWSNLRTNEECEKVLATLKVCFETASLDNLVFVGRHVLNYLKNIFLNNFSTATAAQYVSYTPDVVNLKWRNNYESVVRVAKMAIRILIVKMLKC